MRVYYETLEAVSANELRVLRAIKEGFNWGESSGERIKLWRKDDILTSLQPAEARWGFSKVRGGEKRHLLRALELMSAATPKLTWIVRNENELNEFVLKSGKLVPDKKGFPS